MYKECENCGYMYDREDIINGYCPTCWKDPLLALAGDDYDDDDDTDYDDGVTPNGTNCATCGEDLVQVQNGDWVCPDCDLWL